MPFSSFLPVERPWLQALGQKLLTHKICWAQTEGLPGPFTHCTLPPPEAKHPVLSHQQTCQRLTRCQALAGTPSYSSSKQPLSASPWPPLLLCEGLCNPWVLPPTPPLAASILSTPAPRSFPHTLSSVPSQGLYTCCSFCLKSSLKTLSSHPLPPPQGLYHNLKLACQSAHCLMPVFPSECQLQGQRNHLRPG